MILREAVLDDVPQMQRVRNSVKENKLPDPARITENDYKNYLLDRGKGWVVEIDGHIAGFAIVDLVAQNVWALFIAPAFEGQGFGTKLHDEMMTWYFAQTRTTIWLGTAPNTRAEKFYRNAGWREIGTHGKGEIKFEMSAADWVQNNSNR